jgi:Zn-dependent protease with chaperone function
MAKFNVLMLLNILLSACKAIWSAATSVIWGLAGAFLLTGLVVYFKQDPAIIAGIFKIIGLLVEYWIYIFIVLLIYEGLVSYKEVSK